MGEETVQIIRDTWLEIHSLAAVDEAIIGMLGIKDISSSTDERIQNALETLKNYESVDPDCIKALASDAGISVSRFSHLFKEQTGITFAGYLLLRKIYHTYLGVADGRSITQAAMDGGFSSPAHFATMNKKLFGITPSDICGEFCLHLV